MFKIAPVTTKGQKTLLFPGRSAGALYLGDEICREVVCLIRRSVLMRR